MSRAPRNPFETAPDAFGQPAQKSSKTWLWVLGIIGAVFLLGTMICCGLMFYAWNQASGVIAQAAVEEYADDPIVLEKIGKIQSSEMSLREAMKESTKDEAFTAMVFEISGDKGRGKLVHRTHNQTQEVTVKLVLENGQEFDLEVSDQFNEVEAEIESRGDPESIDDEGAAVETEEPVQAIESGQD